MRKVLPVLLVLFLLPACVLAAEGEPMLSYDDLLNVKDSYEQFLGRLADILIQRELLSADERGAWIALQEGDFLSNGGYGSIMTTFYPGVLEYAQEEEQIIELHAIVEAGVLNLVTMRRYSPDDSSLSGLMLTLGMQDDEGVPMEAGYVLTCSDGIFYKWDAMTAAYVSVGTTAKSEGETVLWSCAAPADGAQRPTLSVACMTLEEEMPLGEAILTLEVDGSGYMVSDNAFRAQE